MRLNYNANYAAKMTQDEKATAEPAQVESSAPTEGMRYVFIDKELEKRVVRKLDIHIMSTLMALCNYQQRLNSVVELETKLQSRSLFHFGLRQYRQCADCGFEQVTEHKRCSVSVALTIFYVHYVVFEWLVLMACSQVYPGRNG
jgi:hypothetical protein